MVAVALCSPKFGVNVGAAMRAAGCFGAELVVYTGRRVKRADFRTDTGKQHRHIPLLHVSDVMDAIPYNCVPVCVEVRDDAEMLPAYRHPRSAMYIFGPEDGSVPSAVVARCRDIVRIPSQWCLNLAATVNVVLYDRVAKGGS